MAIPFLEPSRALPPDALSQLIHEAKTGSLPAFDRLMEVHQRLVLRFAQRILLNRDAARDAAQEVFLRLYRKLHTVDERRDLSPWLYRTTANVCFDILHRAKTNMPVDLLPEPAANARTPEDAAQAGETQQLLLNALHTLPLGERQAIVLRDLDGYSTAEVAQLLGVSEQTIRSQISRGRVKLHAYLTQRGVRLP